MGRTNSSGATSARRKNESLPRDARSQRFRFVPIFEQLLPQQIRIARREIFPAVMDASGSTFRDQGEKGRSDGFVICLGMTGGGRESAQSTRKMKERFGKGMTLQ